MKDNHSDESRASMSTQEILDQKKMLGYFLLHMHHANPPTYTSKYRKPLCEKIGHPYITNLTTRVIQMKSWFGRTCRRSRNSYFSPSAASSRMPHILANAEFPEGSLKPLAPISNPKDISSKEPPQFGGVKGIGKVRIFCEHRVTTTPVLLSNLPKSQTHPMEMNWRCRPRALDEKVSR